MMRLFQNKKINFWFIILLLILIHFCLLNLFKSGWLADEVFHIRFISEWFLANFSDYFFQSQHLIFPPRSPVFGNPPLAMFFMTFGMWFGNIFNISFLFSARFITLLFGIVSFVLMYKITKLISRKDSIAPIISLIFFSTLPAIIVINSTAYLDGFSITFVLLYIYLIIFSIEKKQKNYLLIAAFVFGLSFITKYQSIFILIPFTIYVFPKIKTFVYRKYEYLNFIFIAYLGTAIWVGMRDFNQIFQVFKTVTGFLSNNSHNTGGMFSDYTLIAKSFFNTLFYYLYQIFYKITPTLIFGLLTFLIYYKNTKDKEKYYLKIFLLLAFILPLFFGIMGGIPNTIHRVSLSLPFLLIISSVGVDLFFRWISSKFKLNYKDVFIGLFLLICSFGIVFLNSAYYNSYTNSLNNLFNKQGLLFRNGDGEGMGEIAFWLKNNEFIDKNQTMIGIPRLRFVLSEYMPGYLLYDFPLNEGCEYAFSKGFQYIVIHESHVTGGVMPKVQNEKCLLKVYDLFDKDNIIASVYRVNLPIVDSKKILMNTQYIINTKSKESSLSFHIKDDLYVFRNYIIGGEWVYLLQDIKDTENYNGILFEVESSTKGQSMYIDLIGNGYYLRHKTILDFVGIRKILFNFSQMELIPKDRQEFSLEEIAKIKISFDSKVSLTNEVKIKNLSLIK